MRIWNWILIYFQVPVKSGQQAQPNSCFVLVAQSSMMVLACCGEQQLKIVRATAGDLR
jgi:hypothetical protein